MSLPRYPKYKDSGVEWLGQVPEGWGVVPLKFAFANLDFRRRPLSSEDRAELEKVYPYYGASGIIDYVDRYLFDETLILVAEDGANLLSRSTPLAFLARGKYWVNNHAHILKPRIGSSVYWAAVLEVFDYTPLVSGSAQPKLTGESLASILLPLPPLPEQHLIATFLDHETAKIDALVSEQEKLITLLKEKRQAVISHAVTKGLDPTVPMKDSGVEWLGKVPEGWRVTRLKSVAARIIDCPHETPEYDDNASFLVIRTADVLEGILDTNAMYRVNEIEYKRRTRRAQLTRDDIVYSREGERWGMAASVPISGRFCLGQRMMQFSNFGAHSARFYMWQLNAATTYCQGVVDTAGATSPHVNVETIRNYLLSEPPGSEQDIIAIHLDHATSQLDTLITEAQRVIELLKERRSALISAAVTGQIDVRGLAKGEAA